MDLPTAQRVFSPQEYSRWADHLTRLIQVSTSEGTTDGPYVYFQERITCGWISWRADLTFGSRIPDPALLRRGHVTLFQIVQQRPLRGNESGAAPGTDARGP